MLAAFAVGTKLTANLFMKLANIVFKISPLNSTVPRLHVTPAELMYLVSDFHAVVGGNPVVSLKELDESKEDKALQSAKAEVAKRQSILDALYDPPKDGQLELTPEILERRVNAATARLNSAQDSLKHLEGLKALRNLTPTQERERLCARYGPHKIKPLFTGAIPQLPQNFEEAMQTGVTLDATGDGQPRLLFQPTGA